MRAALFFRPTIRSRAVRIAISLLGALLVVVACAGGNPTVGRNADARASAVDPAVVSTADGAVRGTVADGVRTFLGIPYAAPPVAALRWRPPQPVAGWTGIRAATSPASPCPQPASSDTPVASAVGSTNEDCLYLNVWTPAGAGADRPVMVFLHGGTFVTGAGSDYDASRLVSVGQVVVVTINYRLGALGFLAHQALSVDGGTGDYGLLDQQAALEWVQRSIAGFGGSPARVTIFGESAGGGSVCDQLASPSAAGLFARAIIESAPCAGALPTRAAAEATGATFARAVGCGGATSQAATTFQESRASQAATAACLRGVPVAKLLANTSVNLGFSGGSTFGPVAGGTGLPGQPAALISAGTFNRVPVVQGVNHDEARLLVGVIENGQNSRLGAAEYYALVGALAGSDAAKVRARYPLSAYPSAELALGAVGTDAAFSCPTRTGLTAFAEWVPTYAYEFNDPSAPTPYVSRFISLGAFHTAELSYLFPGLFPTRGGGLTTGQQALSTGMIGYWTRFAATGDPNGAGAPPWPTVARAGVPTVMALRPSGSGPITTFGTDHQCAFWSSLAAATG